MAAILAEGIKRIQNERNVEIFTLSENNFYIYMNTYLTQYE